MRNETLFISVRTCRTHYRCIVSVKLKFSTSVGVFFSGRISDGLRRDRILLLSSLGSILFMALFLYTQNIIILGILGLFVFAPAPVGTGYQLPYAYLYAQHLYGDQFRAQFCDRTSDRFFGRQYRTEPNLYRLQYPGYRHTTVRTLFSQSTFNTKINYSIGNIA